MGINYLTTRIDTSHRISVADALMIPLLWFTNNKSYKVVRFQGEISNLIAHRDFPEMVTLAKKVSGLIGCIVLFPLVLIGLALKKYQITPDSQENYAWVKSIEDTAGSIIIREEAFSLAPESIRVSPEEQAAIETIELQELVSLWEKTDSNNPQFTETSVKLEDWLQNKVLHPNTYTFINSEIVQLASNELQLYLKQLILELKKKNDPKIVEKVVNELVYASGKCSPTWLEVAKREYLKLKCNDTMRQQLLQYLREIKEDLIMDFANENEPGSQWHVINYVRWVAGNELGLDRSQINYDSTVTYEEDRIYPKKECLEIFSNLFTYEQIFNRMQRKIELEHAGTNLSIQMYATTLSSIVDADAIAAGIDIETLGYDNSFEVLERFFEKKDGLYILNLAGVTALMEQLGVVRVT